MDHILDVSELERIGHFFQPFKTGIGSMFSCHKMVCEIYRPNFCCFRSSGLLHVHHLGKCYSHPLGFRGQSESGDDSNSSRFNYTGNFLCNQTSTSAVIETPLLLDWLCSYLSHIFGLFKRSRGSSCYT